MSNENEIGGTIRVDYDLILKQTQNAIQIEATGPDDSYNTVKMWIPESCIAKHLKDDCMLWIPVEKVQWLANKNKQRDDIFERTEFFKTLLEMGEITFTDTTEPSFPTFNPEKFIPITRKRLYPY